jgi:hypothetical protein
LNVFVGGFFGSVPLALGGSVPLALGGSVPLALGWGLNTRTGAEGARGVMEEAVGSTSSRKRGSITGGSGSALALGEGGVSAALDAVGAVGAVGAAVALVAGGGAVALG